MSWLVPRRRAEVARRTPDAFVALQRALSHLIDDFFREVEPSFGPRSGFWGEVAHLPQIDVAETEKGIEVSAELPGMEEKDLNLSVLDGALIIEGEKRQAKEEERPHYLRSERTYGAFRREIPLPAGADLNNLRAEFKGGVLTVRCPKTEEAQRGKKRIPIQAAA